MAIEIATRSCDLAVVNKTSVTTAGTSIANPADVAGLIDPDADGYIRMGAGGALAAPGLFLIPFGEGSSAQTFLMSVFGWDYVITRGSNKAYSTPYLLASFTCTLNTLVPYVNGDAAQACGTPGSALYCGTIVVGVGNANVSLETVSPTGNVKATILMDVKGAKVVQPKFVINASSTSANALYRRVG